jgi:(p)ppGpp synthase/HD superfamily hydrolase
MQFTPRIEQAINKAAYAHRNQMRKGSDLPYITHPFGVMCIASQATADEDTLIACLFHDIFEDVPEEYPRHAMVADFGENVVAIVEDVTKNTSLDSWRQRQEAYLQHLAEKASDQAVIVSCADKIHNLTATLHDHGEIGDELWQRFNAGKDQQKWWYQSILAVTNKRLPQLELNNQLGGLVEKLTAL